MSMARRQCDSCKGTFTPHGLSLHIAKTQNTRCRTVFSASQSGLAFTSVPGAASLQAQIPSRTSQPSLANEYGFADDWMPSGGYGNIDADTMGTDTTDAHTTDANTVDVGMTDDHTTEADFTDGGMTDTNVLRSDADATDSDDDAMDSDDDAMDANAMGSDTNMMDANLTGADTTDADSMDSDADMTGSGDNTMDADTAGDPTTDTDSTDADMTDTDATDADTMDSDVTDLGADAMDADAAASTVITQFPFGCPGAPIIGPQQASSLNGSSSMATGDSVWSPFCSQLDWEIAQWAKTCGATSSVVTKLLAIPGVVDRLGLSYRTAKQLNSIIDGNLPGLPPFQREELVIGYERLEFYFRDALQCIRSLWGDPNLAQHLVFAPEQHYTSDERTCRILNEMHTGDWWWSQQASIESRQPGATIVPVILSSDKTQLTILRGKMAYPIYLTIGNIPKDIRRKPSCHAQVLIGYIPTTSLERVANKAARCRALGNLFHSCMETVLAPIASCGELGVAMMSADGIWRRCHPILASFVGDYPEQALVTCTYNGRCSKCQVPSDQLGEYREFLPHVQSDVINTYHLARNDVPAFRKACREAGLKPVLRPFWVSHRFTDIFLSITPDILHQLLQGVVKHVIKWLSSPTVFGSVDIDARCQSLPPNHSIRLFSRGITTLSRVTGKEHKDMCRILLGLIVDLSLPGGQVPSRVIKAVRALLDFLYLAQFPSHTTDTLRRLQDSLGLFHDNKAVFVDLGTREGFDIPKLHSLLHYFPSIMLFGTTDNYNTEQTERLHIDLTKDAYRATNRKDEYRQMTAWLERREKVQQRVAFVGQQQHGQPRAGPMVPIGPPQALHGYPKIARTPSIKSVSFDDLARKYGALYFQDALADFVTRINYPGALGPALRKRAEDMLIPFRAVPIFHKIKFVAPDNHNKSEVVDAVHARPEQPNLHGKIIPSRFDTVLVRNEQGSAHGNKDQVAQVRAVFQIPRAVVQDIFLPSDITPPTYLAYVEWFSRLPAAPEPIHGMYKVSRLMQNGQRRASIIPVELILCSVHLFPRFSPNTPQAWNSLTVLEHCRTFYVNPFVNRQSYMTFA